MSTTINLKRFAPYQVDDLRRIGNKNDGGYVVDFPSLLLADCLVNYGVGYNVEFEMKFNELTGKPVYAFDPTMKKSSYLFESLQSGEYYNTFKQVIRRTIWFFREKTLKKYKINFIEEGLAEVNSDFYKTYNYHLKKYQLEDKKIFLKIDIEDSEYAVLRDAGFYEHINNVLQLVIEFHRIEKRIGELENIIQKLQNTHTIIHIHANNNGGTFLCDGKNVPEVLEIVFIHNSLLPQKKLSVLNYPAEGLDYPCNWRKKDIPLTFFK